MLQAVRVRLLWVLVAAAALSLNLQAEPLRQISPHGYVSDFANVLDPASMESLDELCYRLEHWTGTPLNAVTVPSLGGDSSQTFALKVFNEQSEFPGSPSRRIVILFGAKERKFTIIAAAEVRPILSGKVRQYQREVARYLRQHQDGAAIALLTRRIAEDIALEAQVGLKEVNDYVPLGDWAPVAQPDQVFKESLGAMAALWSVVIAAIFLVKRLRRGRPAKPALAFVVIGNEPAKNLTT
jgi:uncharacterized membrane protein YgcG